MGTVDLVARWFGIPRALVIAALIASAPRVGRADGWVTDIGVRGGVAEELVAESPSDRLAWLPALSLAFGHTAPGGLIFARVRLGVPAFYGQAGAGVGLAMEWPIGAGIDRNVVRGGAPSRRTHLLYASAEAGGQISYSDLSPESPGSARALVYWGPHGRLEGGLRVLWDASSGRQVGVTVSAACEVVAAHYIEPTAGRGTRVGVDVGIGAELRF